MDKHPFLIKTITLSPHHPHTTLRIALFQVPSIPVDNHPWELYRTLIDASQPHYVIFPEHVWDPDASPHHTEIMDTIARHTLHWKTYVIGGTWIDRETSRSVSMGFYMGQVIYRYEKLNPTENERKAGIRPGRTLVVLEEGSFRWSVLICADIFQHEFFNLLHEQDVSLVFLPTASPYKANDTREKQLERDEQLYRKNAERLGGVLVKVCTLGFVKTKLQGRTLVALPDRILYRNLLEDHFTPLFIVIELSRRKSTWTGQVILKKKLTSSFTSFPDGGSL